ncbi:C6 transcription factor [Penicillium fimorum]|uniref:C6 transcription factor n=1 Tax=Penicillium fimorum TaxID=1882269 RepID=A0A9X0CAD6_9EURO|nr:C6 transcription factor [Penicillium fimorum]
MEFERYSRIDVRCIRLGKRCAPSESARKRNLQTTPVDVSDTRIARLEDKMESLLSAMQCFIGSTGGSGSSANILQPLSLNGDSISSATSYSNRTLITPTSTNLGFNEESTYSTESISTGSLNPNPPFLSHPYPLSPSTSSPNQTEERLNFFRTRMLPSFPFLNFTPDMTGWFLRQNRPFLFQAIHTVTTFSTQERLIQVEELKRLLFTSALIKVESNIDLLLGLLTYLAWSTDAFLGRADLISRLMMLAISLVYDLRLFKPSSPGVKVMMAITQGDSDKTDHSPEEEAPYCVFERQRAVLACFILSSNVSSHLGRQDAIRWTPQMEEALQLIATNKSCAADELFVAQVRLQRLKQRAEDVRQQDETNYARTGTASAASVPRILYLKTLRRELHDLRSSFRVDLQQVDILNTHAQYVELYINQLAYSISQDAPLDLAGRRGGGVLLEFERLDCLWQSVENIKSWLDNFYQIPSPKLVGQPFHFWSQMILSITLLKYLSTLKDPEWDCQAVRNTVHLISTMESMRQKLDLSSKEPELHCHDHLLKFLSKLLSKCQVWAEARWNIGSETGNGDTRPCQSDPHNSPIPDLDQMVWMQSMDLGNDQWFEDVLGMPATFF